MVLCDLCGALFLTTRDGAARYHRPACLWFTDHWLAGHHREFLPLKKNLPGVSLSILEWFVCRESDIIHKGKEETHQKPPELYKKLRILAFDFKMAYGKKGWYGE